MLYCEKEALFQIKDMIVIEKDQKTPMKYVAESVFDSRQKLSSNPKVSQLQAHRCRYSFLVVWIT